MSNKNFNSDTKPPMATPKSGKNNPISGKAKDMMPKFEDNAKFKTVPISKEPPMPSSSKK